MIPVSSLDDLRARNPVPAIAGKWVSLRRGSRAGSLVGPCPICSTDMASRTAARFECTDAEWVCAVCPAGGDVIRLVQMREGLDFRAAVQWLGGAQDVDSEEAERRAREAAAKKAKAEAAGNRYREEERERLYRWWRGAGSIVGTPVEAYHALRGLAVPAGVRLRYLPSMRFTIPDGRDERGRDQWRTLHEGPAQLAAITAPDGHFLGLHITWLDLSQTKGTARLVHPVTGEVLSAKKMRGTKQGGQIELLRCASPRCLVIGEGIETVLSVHAAMLARGRPMDGIAFWSAGDLGNLAGRAADGSRVRHPSARDKAGRARSVPGAEPDLASAAVTIPDSVSDLRLLGDGDSDPFATRLVMERAQARHAHEGRRITIAWPSPGKDFNDMRRDHVRAREPAGEMA